MKHLLIQGDARRIPLADGSVHCVITSPPYWGLRTYGVDRQIGLEPTPDLFVAELVAVFREVWRVLRDDGTCWLNLGDTYSQDTKWGGSSSNKNEPKVGYPRPSERGQSGLKPKDLCGIPWRVALALQADGWYLRSDIIWSKPNPMPESVADRPTKAHEYLFLLTKSERYFYDADAIRKADKGRPSGNDFKNRQGSAAFQDRSGGIGGEQWEPGRGANSRSVWTISTQPFPGAHFATFPRKLIEPCIKAGTSEKGCCPACGAPWVRMVEKDRVATRPGNNSKVHGAVSVHPESPYHDHNGMICGNRDPQRHCTVTRTAGWKPSCDCPAADPVPATVFDPFNGAGTTPLVAVGLGRNGIGTDLSRDYLAMSRRRIERPHATIRAGKDEPLPLFSDGG
jgi:DNA modification methylase